MNLPCRMAITLSIFSLGCSSFADDSQLIEISNEKDIVVSVAPRQGGELSSLAVKFKGSWHELIYKAKQYPNTDTVWQKVDKAGWRGKAPLLWPATGVSKIGGAGNKGFIGQYQLEGITYPMPFHGFAGNMEWQILNRDSRSIALGISANDYSRQYYPFGFEVVVVYTVTDKLVIDYQVTADKGNQMLMPFSIGNHMTFNVPFVSDSSANMFTFSNPCAQRVERIKGLPTGELLPAKPNQIQRFDALPERKSQSFTHCNDEVSTGQFSLQDESGLTLNISHTHAQSIEKLTIDFNLWASKQYGFISPEPWVGAQNSLNSGYGLIQLAAGESWAWKIELQPSIKDAVGTVQ